jgi:hypothetical protein
MMTKPEIPETAGTGSNVLLTGVILLANVDFAGLTDYALKAVIGGGIWLAFKLASDYLETKIKKGK